MNALLIDVPVRPLGKEGFGGGLLKLKVDVTPLEGRQCSYFPASELYPGVTPSAKVPPRYNKYRLHTRFSGGSGCADTALPREICKQSNLGGRGRTGQPPQTAPSLPLRKWYMFVCRECQTQYLYQSDRGFLSGLTAEKCQCDIKRKQILFFCHKGLRSKRFRLLKREFFIFT